LRLKKTSVNHIHPGADAVILSFCTCHQLSKKMIDLTGIFPYLIIQRRSVIGAAVTRLK
jgi:hypothetical protein